MGLSVSGGVGGIEACLEDLAVVSRVLLSTAATVSEAAHMAEFGRLEIGGCSGLDLGVHNAQLDDVLAGLSRPTAHVLHAADDLRTLAALVHAAAENYEHADSSLASQLGHLFTSLPAATLEADFSFLTHGNPLTAMQRFLTADPDAVGLLSSAMLGANTPALGSAWCADGNPVVTDELNDVTAAAVTAPRSMADLMTGLSERNDGDDGEISVSFVYGTGGVRHVIVDIPGTKSWSPLHTTDVTSLATNFRAIEGAETSYERGVLVAMAEAGVTAQDDVMLVGHSEGGMVAVAAARDSVGTFHVSHVVTAGAPIGRTVGSVPDGTQVLALEGRHDIVPRLDGKTNPDRPNITTVHGGSDHGSIGANHNLDDSYVPLAQEVDASHNASTRAFIGSADGFLDQEYMTTERFRITREY